MPISVYSGGGSGLTYNTTFDNGDLVAGVLTVTHNLGVSILHVTVYDNSNNQITPDEITVVDTSSLTIDLSSYGTLSGTWNARVSV